MDCRLADRQERTGPSQTVLQPGAGPAASGRAAAAVSLRMPFHVLGFHLPGGRCRARQGSADPPSLRNVGPRPRPGGPARTSSPAGRAPLSLPLPPPGSCFKVT